MHHVVLLCVSQMFRTTIFNMGSFERSLIRELIQKKYKRARFYIILYAYCFLATFMVYSRWVVS
jgi:hypothetical protein